MMLAQDLDNKNVHDLVKCNKSSVGEVAETAGESNRLQLFQTKTFNVS